MVFGSLVGRRKAKVPTKQHGMEMLKAFGSLVGLGNAKAPTKVTEMLMVFGSLAGRRKAKVPTSQHVTEMLKVFGSPVDPKKVPVDLAVVETLLIFDFHHGLIPSNALTVAETPTVVDSLVCPGTVLASQSVVEMPTAFCSLADLLKSNRLKIPAETLMVVCSLDVGLRWAHHQEILRLAPRCPLLHLPVLLLLLLLLLL